MTVELLLKLLHEVGPRWATLICVGVWVWRVTPWFGRQLEKLIDAKIAPKQ